MNIISNCCANAYYYRDYLKCEYQNPFIWNIIKADDMYNLILNYNKINFENIELIRYKNYFIPKINGVIDSQYNFVCGLNVDNTFKVFFPHNYYSESDKTPRINNAEIYYYKNYELTVENWLKRIKRMKGKPIYLILTQRGSDFSIDKTRKILQDFPEEDIIIITSFKLKDLETKNHKIYIVDTVETGPNIVLNKIKNFKI